MLLTVICNVLTKWTHPEVFRKISSIWKSYRPIVIKLHFILSPHRYFLWIQLTENICVKKTGNIINNSSGPPPLPAVLTVQQSLLTDILLSQLQPAEGGQQGGAALSSWPGDVKIFQLLENIWPTSEGTYSVK